MTLDLEQAIRLTDYMDNMRLWNPALVEIRERMPLEVQYAHMMLDIEYDEAAEYEEYATSNDAMVASFD